MTEAGEFQGLAFEGKNHKVRPTLYVSKPMLQGLITFCVQ